MLIPDSENIAGSSPRGRGTGQDTVQPGAFRRFIPAWAGNRSSTAPRERCRSVHPRVGGEQTSLRSLIAENNGSSPRGRGTARGSTTQGGLPRFIPAWAGNSTPKEDPQCPATVHPRVGGEQARQSQTMHFTSGSSPRGRGTGHAASSCACVQRFIPAWAGNRPRDGQRRPAGTVHPRVGGEQVSTKSPHHGNAGSSPRGRGTVRLTLHLAVS